MTTLRVDANFPSFHSDPGVGFGPIYASEGYNTTSEPVSEDTQQCLFPSFEQSAPSSKSIWDDPESIRRLNFNDHLNRKVLTDGNLVIGIYEDCSSIVRPKTMLAFDKNTNHLVWSLPIKDILVHWEMTSLGLALAYGKDPVLHITDPKTGEERLAVLLPAIPGNSYDKIHITPSGFCYYSVRKDKTRMLYGAQISTGEWKQTFEMDEEHLGSFKPLGPYVCYNVDFKNTQIIVSRDGSTQTVTNCSDIAVKNDKVFIVEMKSTKDSKVTFAMQPLVKDSDVFRVEGVRKEVSVDFKYFKLLGVGDDNTVIGLTENKSYTNQSSWFERREGIYFIDVEKGEFIGGQCALAMSGAKFLDESTSSVWSRNYQDQALWRQAKDGSQKIGILQGGSKISFVHVDKENRLYIMDLT